MKFSIVLKVMVMAALFFWTMESGLCRAAESDPDQMDVSAFGKTKRPRVIFAHDDHNETADLHECGRCHHVWEKGELVEDESSEDQSCSDCHSIKSGPENKISLINAFHMQCRSCHFEGNKGPVLCGQCHRK